MSYLVVPGSFAPKCPKYVKGRTSQNVHSISYHRCNFNCEFCFFKYYKHTNNYVDFSAEEFEELVNKLLPTGQMFKFTGGEPTLNPELERDLSIVKQAGGTCFVDTNGSFPMLIEKLIQTNLVDLFGISLKGLSAAEAVKRSGTRNEESCWGNVLKSISIISNNSAADLIVTYVCYDDFETRYLDEFAHILLKYQNVFLKINNYQPNEDHPTPNLRPQEPLLLADMIESYVKEHPIWKGRVTLVNGPKAISDASEIIWI